jgi:hypothetical protein
LKGAAASTILRRIRLIGLALTLSACATGPKFTGVEPPVENMGDIYLYRVKTRKFTGIGADVIVDGKKTGALFRGTYLHLRLRPGMRHIDVASGIHASNSDIYINVQAGKTAFYQYSFRISQKSLNPPLPYLRFGKIIEGTIEPRERDRALEDLAELQAGHTYMQLIKPR